MHGFVPRSRFSLIFPHPEPFNQAGLICLNRLQSLLYFP